VEGQSVAGYSKNDKGKARELPAPGTWKRLLHSATLTIGCNNIFGQDPPKAYNGNTRYPDFIYYSTGRFIYASLKKTF